MRRAAALVLLCACAPDRTDKYTPPEASTGGENSGGPELTSGPSPPPPPSDDDGDDTSGGIGFIDGSEMGGPDFECNILERDCADDEKCMPWANDGGNAWNATKCTPLDPNPGDLGDPCTVEESPVSGIDTCKRHAMCWDVDLETLEGECIGMCIGSSGRPTCEEDFTECTFSEALALCIPQCHPLEQDCAPEASCIPSGEGFLCVLIAVDGAYGDPCEFVNHCGPRLFCADPLDVPDCEATHGCCQRFCDLNQFAATQCAGYPAETCTPWYPDGVPHHPQYENLGACAIPSP